MKISTFCPLIFSFHLAPLPPSGIIRVLLTSTLTPLVRCKADTTGHDQCLGNRFLLCSTEGAKHIECKGQHAIDISISELPREYSWTSYINCLVCVNDAILFIQSQLASLLHFFNSNVNHLISQNITINSQWSFISLIKGKLQCHQHICTYILVVVLWLLGTILLMFG